ncbi:innexin unc-7-like isoform X2 [Littorina saxatilis]|uniref:Innexin n=1 Tax=Littorina saxatilis TaxID=31220 RepID=A0AAN9GLN9_9CAEN
MDWTRTPDFDLGVFSQFSLFDAYGQDAASMLTANFTFLCLLVVAGFLSAIQLVGEPIECWCPAETSDAMCNYTKSFCWVSKQYVIDYDDPIPMDSQMRYDSSKRELAFYPLVPFILLSLACVLKIPNFLWNAFMDTEGLNIPKAVKLGLNPEQNGNQAEMAVAFEISFPLDKGKQLHRGRMRRFVTSRLESVQKLVAALGCFPLGSGLGAYQTGLFMFTRLLALGLCVAAFPGVGYALGTNFSLWGWELGRWLVTDTTEFWDTYVFPRETLCDFKVRQMSNVQDFTVQCVLPINMWSEKVFLALWFWLVLLVLANAYSYQYWFRKLIFSSNRRHLASKHLRIINAEQGTKPRKEVTTFALNYLNHDSILVLKMLEVCVGDQFANGVVKRLWTEFKKLSNKYDKPPARNLSMPVEEMEKSLDSLNSAAALH